MNSKNKFNLLCDLHTIKSPQYMNYQNIVKLDDSLTDLNASIDLQIANDKENTEHNKLVLIIYLFSMFFN